MRTRGFTLIELLVVIAIIGILSAVVLASLNSARSKGSDAAIQSNLSTIRSQAELYYNTTGNYSYGSVASNGSCTAANTLFSDSNIQRAASAAHDLYVTGTVVCNSSADGTTYAVFAPLTDGTHWWCVDSASVGRSVTTNPGVLTACPAS